MAARRDEMTASIMSHHFWRRIRFDAKELTAFKIAAMADERPIALIGRRVMRAWLTKEGFLHPESV
jgi:hypothetical protein